MGYYFLLISSWLALFLGPILILSSIWFFGKKKTRKAGIFLGVGVILTAYALYLWIPEINRSHKSYELRQEELKNSNGGPKDDGI